MLNGLTTAARTLSIVPLRGREAERPADALPWFPAVGGLMGLALYGVALGVNELTSHQWPGGVAACVIVGAVVLTGGFHLDGLADWADGFGGGPNRQSTLRIMKDSRIGTFGVLALLCVLLLKWVALARLAALGMSVWIVAAYVVSRALLVDLAVWLPYARPEGGTGAVFVCGARPWHLAAALLSAATLLLIGWGTAGLLALALGWVIARTFGFWCRRRVGGITGDLLGASSEIVESAVLMSAALAGAEAGRLLSW